jgi:predicted lipoprotein
MRILAVVFMLLATPAFAQAATVSVSEVLREAVVNVFRPAFNDLAAKAVALEADVGALCAAPSAASLAAARDDFAAVALAHARIEFFRFGPMTEENRGERLLFWPDPKGIALRQTQAILAQKDEAATSQDTLRRKSVAVQGLTALEYVLWGTGADELTSAAGDFRCRYGHAIAIAITSVTGEIADAWNAEDGIAAHITNPGPDNTDFRTQPESLTGLLASMAHTIEEIGETRLGPFMGANGARANPRLALYWRSGLTLPAIRANFAGAAALFSGSSIAGLAPGWMGDNIAFELRKADATAAKVTLPVAEALKNSAQKADLDQLAVLTSSLHEFLTNIFPPALGLAIGFQSNKEGG